MSAGTRAELGAEWGFKQIPLGKLLPLSLPKAPKLKDQLGYELRHHPEHGLASSHCPWNPVWGILSSTPPPASWHRDPNIHSKQPVARGHGVISDSTCALVSLPNHGGSPTNSCLLKSQLLQLLGMPHPLPWEPLCQELVSASCWPPPPHPSPQALTCHAHTCLQLSCWDGGNSHWPFQHSQSCSHLLSSLPDTGWVPLGSVGGSWELLSPSEWCPGLLLLTCHLPT